MTSPDERASSSARNAALKLVEDALKSGRIVQADHDMRRDQLQRAQTMQDIDLQTRDLRAAPPAAPPVVPQTASAPVSVGAAAGQQPWPLVNYGPGSTSSAEVTQLVGAVNKGGKAIGGIIAIIVLASVVVPIAGAIIAFVSARDSFPDFGDLGPTDETTYLPGQAPGENGVNVHTVEGYDEMVDALREETGATYVFNAVIYPRYAVLNVPTGVNERYEAYYWDGSTMEKNTSRGTSSDGQIDMSLIEPELLISALETVRDRLDSPTSWYVNMYNNTAFGAQINASASNSFGESTTLIMGLDGTVVYDSEAP